MELLEGVKGLILQLGIMGIFVATALEYGCLPISSEVLLPFIGFAVANSEIGFFSAVVAATVGGLVGSSACYILGRMGGEVFEKLAARFCAVRIGIEKAQCVFCRYGKASVFIARLFPIARTYISFPAGMAKMEYPSFLIFTGLGAILWNTALIGVGCFMGSYVL